MTEAVQSIAGTGLSATLVAIGAILTAIGVRVAWSGGSRRDSADALEYLSESLNQLQRD